jgi:hypothetical protein
MPERGRPCITCAGAAFFIPRKTTRSPVMDPPAACHPSCIVRPQTGAEVFISRRNRARNTAHFGHFAGIFVRITFRLGALWRLASSVRRLAEFTVGPEAPKIGRRNRFDRFKVREPKIRCRQRTLSHDIVALQQFDLITRDQWLT